MGLSRFGYRKRTITPTHNDRTIHQGGDKFIMSLLKPLLPAMRQAAQLCHIVQQNHIIRSEKTGAEPVTIADYGSQALIGRALSEHYPLDGVMAEESGHQFMTVLTTEQQAEIVALIGEIIGQSTTVDEVRAWLDHNAGLETDRIWIIDPIDGTKGFLAGRNYVNALGILENRRPVGGALTLPAYADEQYPNGILLYTTDNQSVVEALDNPDDTPQPIHVSAVADLGQFRGLESVEKGHAGLARLARVRELAGIPNDTVIQIDSMEKYGRVAFGVAEIYMRLPRIGSTRPHNIWDHAPGVAILEKAGGIATDIDGSPLDFSTGTTLNNYGVIASNNTCHDAVIRAVGQLLQEEENA
jgi:3'(2'), 5'-bisphosphate nucleotidase